MALAVAYTRAYLGMEAVEVSVETHLANGLPAFSIVGLPEMAVRESRERVRAALQNASYTFPDRRITVNLAPAELPKSGGHYDLPVAVGILIASGQLDVACLAEYELVGELGLTGELRNGRGILPMALAAKRASRKLIVPMSALAEARLVSGLEVYGANHLLDVCAHLSGHAPLPAPLPVESVTATPCQLDFADIHGQSYAKRALEIAAAGGHHILMFGPPGTGKTMLASRLPSILPPMSEAEALETAALHSVSRAGFKFENWMCRPYRAPHHTISGVALVGGGSLPQPGEISLAHQGVLFLDELAEFSRQSLEVLRQPLETGEIAISRAACQVTFLARFQLVAAMNPCPCGYHGDAQKPCACTSEQVARYWRKLSGPLLDRIDIQIPVSRLTESELIDSAVKVNESSVDIKQRVLKARQWQWQRIKKNNAALHTRELEEVCRLCDSGYALAKQAMRKFALSARAYHRVLKVARTIADLAGSTNIKPEHFTEALGYRQFERN